MWTNFLKMLTPKVVNWITNLFGTVGGVPQIIEGYFLIENEQVGHGIAKIAEGIGIFAIGYFTGKSALSQEPAK